MRRVRPARERLHAHHVAPRQVHDRLVDDVELVARDGMTEIALQLDTLGDGGAHGLVEHGDGVATGVLGLVHRRVRVADEHLGRGHRVLTGGEGKADAGRDVEEHPAHDEGSREARTEAVGKVHGLGTLTTCPRTT